MPSRPGRRRAIVSAALVGAVLCVASVVSWSRASAQQARALVVSPTDQLIDGQYVDVSISGFQPNRDVRVRLCSAAAKSLDDCAVEPSLPSDPGASRIVRTDSNGSASSPFIVKAKDVASRGGSTFQCDAESPCKVYAFDLDLDGNELSFGASVSGVLSYALSTLTCPETEPRVAGSGASAIQVDFVEWQAETCQPPLSLDVSFATSNSVNGKQAFVQGLTDADFAISAVSLTDGERQQLTSAKVQALHVPVALGGLVLAYNYWVPDKNGTLVQVKDLQLSPDTAAKILNGQIGLWDDPAIKADNIDNHPDGFPTRQIVPIGRADNCAATWWLTSWFDATARAAWESGGDAFKGGPTTIFPSAGSTDLRTGAAKVAQGIRFEGAGNPDRGRIGFVYYSDALKLGLPVVALKNAAGKFVKPTAGSIDAAVADGSVSSDGIFTPNFTKSDTTAYPLPVVTYAIVPKAGARLDAAHELVLSKFLKYAVGEGQQKAESRGYVPLPASLTAKSNAAIAEVYAAPTPTPAAHATAAPTSAPQAAATETGPTPAPTVAASNFGSGNTSSSGDLSAGGTVAPSSPETSTTPAAPVPKVITGALKLLGGGSAPVTVQGFLWFGAIVAILGRAMSVIADRRRVAADRHSRLRAVEQDP